MSSCKKTVVGRRQLMLALCLSVGAAGCSHFSHGHHHGHGAHHGGLDDRSALALDDGQKWPTDASLRKGMREIRALVADSPFSTGSATADPLAAKQIAMGVEGQVAYLIKNCELEPKADAALHVLISDMLEGAEALKKATPSAAGLALINNALAEYPKYFDDERW